MFHVKNRYNIFVSHSWHYSEHYNTISEWIEESNINNYDYSISLEKKLPRMPKYQLQSAITEQIAHASIVIIPAAMYTEYSEWINYEINESVRMCKKILGVIPWGQKRTSMLVTMNATATVHWQKDSIIKGIKALL